MTSSKFERVVIFVALAISNLIIVGVLFALAYEYDNKPLSQWASILFEGSWLFFGLGMIVVSKIDTIIRVSDLWYVLGSVIYAFFWSGMVMIAASRLYKSFKGQGGAGVL